MNGPQSELPELDSPTDPGDARLSLVPPLHSAAALSAFFDALHAAPAPTLVLDYDGTLAPFHVDPAQARPWPGVLRRLDAIADHARCRLVIVSGRPAAELLPLLRLRQRPEIWGAHGWERLRADGRSEVRVLAATARSTLAEALRRGTTALAMGARLESKPASLALHWRGLQPGMVRDLGLWTEQAWRPLTREGDLALLPFDGGLELRAAGCSKALAVATLLEESRHEDGTKNRDGACAYLGDDITDEDAFRALDQQALGRRGLSVLVRDQWRETAAAAWIRPPQGLLAFLDRWQAALTP